jgi:superinfection exclusion protein B
MIPDSKWLDALKLPTRILFGLFIFFLAMIVLDQYKLITLSSFGESTRLILIITALLFGSLTFTSIIGFFIDIFIGSRKHSALRNRRIIREKEQEENRALYEKKVIERIEHLSQYELNHLADALRENSQSFYTWIHSPYASTLAAKGMIYTPGGTHLQDHYPFTINDFVWKELLKRKDEILKRDDENAKRE